MKKESKMIKQFMDILERMRHLSKDQKAIFYFFVYEDRENLSLLSIKELEGLENFANKCWELIGYFWPKDAVDEDFPHLSNQLHQLVDALPHEIFVRYRKKIERGDLPGAPLSGCESCGWVHGYTNHELRYVKEFEQNLEICPSCRHPTVVISKDSII